MLGQGTFLHLEPAAVLRMWAVLSCPLACKGADLELCSGQAHCLLSLSQLLRPASAATRL